MDYRKEIQKDIKNGQGIDAEPAVHHQIPAGVFFVIDKGNGEKEDVDMRKVVGSKGKKEKESGEDK